MLGKILVVCLVAVAPHALASHDLNPADQAQDMPETLLCPGGEPVLSDYLDLALRRNRAAKAAHEEWQGFLERAPQARALPNPILSYGHFVESVETRIGPQERRLGLTQRVPWFGTLGLKGDVALSQAEVYYQHYRDALQKVVRDVSVAYAEYYYLGAALHITQGNMDLLTGWEDILRARYTTGSVTYSDLIKVQVELGKLQDLLRTLEDQRVPRMTRLGALLDLPLGTVLAVPTVLPGPVPLDTTEALRARLLDGNTELKILAARVESADLQRDLAGKKSYPTFALGLDWIQTGTRDIELEDNGRDALMAKVAVELPFWRGSISAAKREAAALHRAAQERRVDRKTSLLSMLDEMVFRFEDAQRKTSLYRDSLIPKGDQSLQAAFAAFESGDGDFLSVLDAERALLEFGLSLERSRADQVRAQANLDLLTGSARIRGKQ